MPVFRDGQQNILGLTNPGAYVSIIPPTAFVNGVPTNIEAVIGVGSWGPKNTVTVFSDLDSIPYGPPVNRSFDIAKHVAVALTEGNRIGFRGVRVTDGTDVAATGVWTGTGGGTFTARHTGTLGNSITVTFQESTKVGSLAAVVNFPGRSPERWDNITGTGTTFWANVASAINTGTDQRPRSDYVTFTASTMTTLPTVGTTLTLSGGTDGASGVDKDDLMGSDILPRTGLYALRGISRDTYGTPDTFTIADLTDSTTWAAQLSFAISEGMYALVAAPSGTSITDTVALRKTLGLDDVSLKIIAGDWPSVYITNLGLKMVNPTAVAQGLYGNLSPQLSPINKPLRGVVSTAQSQTGVLLSDAEESVAQTGGIDFIGRSSSLNQDFFSFITGRNASSNTAAQGDEYTRLTNFIARALQGPATRAIVGKQQSIRADDPTRAKAKAVLDSFFATMVLPEFGVDGYGMIDDFAVTCDETNNPPTTVERGFLFAFCAVRYLNIVRYFVIRLAGGGNVQVRVSDTRPTLATALAAIG